MSSRTQVGALPPHVAIIMDGNGRWAERHGLARHFGHVRGVERLRDIVRLSCKLPLETLTVFAFSTENWRRPNYEVAVLMRVFRRFVIREVDELDMLGVRVRFIGQLERLPADLRRLMLQMEDRTAENQGLTLQIAVSYGARAEITRSVRQIAEDVAAGRLSPDEITEEHIGAGLWTAPSPDPDLVIRTSGESRISNFLLWQSAYAEYAFVDECWPEFSDERFLEVLSGFGRRDRRFGGVRASG